MAWTQDEIEYLKNHSNVFDSGNLGTILNHLNTAVIDKEVTRNMANKLAFYSAMALDKESIALVVENRGSSRSSRRADAGQRIMRVHYGIKAEGLKPRDEDTDPIIHISQRVRSPKVAVKMYEFTYFKGTLKPESLERLMLKPLLDYNVRSFGKSFVEVIKSAMSKVDWASIDEE